MKTIKVFSILLLFISFLPSAFAEDIASDSTLERATGEQLSRAAGHYARARSLLIAAIREFDKGYQVASPEAILDATTWRKELISRAADLERVLDPQPRASNIGTRFEEDTRLLDEAVR